MTSGWSSWNGVNGALLGQQLSRKLEMRLSEERKQRIKTSDNRSGSNNAALIGKAML